MLEEHRRLRYTLVLGRDELLGGDLVFASQMPEALAIWRRDKYGGELPELRQRYGYLVNWMRDHYKNELAGSGHQIKFLLRTAVRVEYGYKVLTHDGAWDDKTLRRELYPEMTRFDYTSQELQEVAQDLNIRLA